MEVTRGYLECDLQVTEPVRTLDAVTLSPTPLITMTERKIRPFPIPIVETTCSYYEQQEDNVNVPTHRTASMQQEQVLLFPTLDHHSRRI